jgi:hypothetical protein
LLYTARTLTTLRALAYRMIMRCRRTQRTAARCANSRRGIEGLRSIGQPAGKNIRDASIHARAAGIMLIESVSKDDDFRTLAFHGAHVDVAADEAR